LIEYTPGLGRGPLPGAELLVKNKRITQSTADTSIFEKLDGASDEEQKWQE
jgi:hypothetical protein